jgi:dTDP-4-amino-4,6-dideoxygalactose transaminase
LDLTEHYSHISADIDHAIRGVLTSQRFILGPEVEALELRVAELLGATHAIGCASGTDALLLPLLALDAPPEAEVVVPAFTFFATAGAVWNAGLRPAFCDVDRDTFNVCEGGVAEAWTERTRAVIPVHLFGQMAPMEGLARFARARGAFVLEDAAQAIGAHAHGAPVGAHADACALSFFPTKNLGAFGDAGMITTSDDGLAEKLRKIRVHGGVQMYHHELVGTNSRLDSLQAAVLLAKLPHLGAWTDARRRNAVLYDELLAGLPELITPLVRPDGFHVYNQYTVRVRRRAELRAFLDARGIGTGIYYPVPLHLQHCFRSLGYAAGDFPVSESLSQEVLSLPIYPEVGEARIRAVVAAIRDFYHA